MLLGIKMTHSKGIINSHSLERTVDSGTCIVSFGPHSFSDQKSKYWVAARMSHQQSQF